MNFIALPSGKIINLNLVTEIIGSAGRRNIKPAVVVFFPAMAANNSAGACLKTTLLDEDINAFLDALQKLGVNIDSVKAIVTSEPTET